MVRLVTWNVSALIKRLESFKSAFLTSLLQFLLTWLLNIHSCIIRQILWICSANTNIFLPLVTYNFCSWYIKISRHFSWYKITSYDKLSILHDLDLFLLWLLWSNHNNYHSKFMDIPTRKCRWAICTKAGI